MRVLILHGLGGSGSDHWQAWLAERLRERGEDVSFPDLPDPDAPRLDRWLTALQSERRPDDVVVCHSLACCLWLHHRDRGGAPAARALLVAPPCRNDVPEIAPFLPVPLAPGLVPEAEVWASGDDPWCPAGAIERYAAPLGVEHQFVEGGGHLNPEAGLGPWPEALNWVVSPSGPRKLGPPATSPHEGAKNGVET